MKYKLAIVLFILMSTVVTAGCFGDNGDDGQYGKNYRQFLDGYDVGNGIWPDHRSKEVYLSDKIHYMEYFKDIKKTRVVLKSATKAKDLWLDDSVTFNPKSGNLLERYKIGNVIDIKLHIIKIDDTNYETLEEWIK